MLTIILSMILATIPAVNPRLPVVVTYQSIALDNVLIPDTIAINPGPPHFVGYSSYVGHFGYISVAVSLAVYDLSGSSFPILPHNDAAYQ